jgi:hypothetical protein
VIDTFSVTDGGLDGVEAELSSLRFDKMAQPYLQVSRCGGLKTPVPEALKRKSPVERSKERSGILPKKREEP